MAPEPETRIPKRYRLLLTIAGLFRSDLKDMQIDRQIVAVGDIISFLFSFPLTITGLVWLVIITDWSLIKDHPWELLLFTFLFLVFYYLRFFLIVELRAHRYGSSDGSLAGMILWSVVLLYGPTMLWLAVLGSLFEFISNWQGNSSRTTRWSQVHNLSLNLAGSTTVALTALTIYQYFGGGLSFRNK